MNFEKALAYGRKYMGGTNETYKVKLAGRTMYIITSPREASTAYRDTSALSFEEFIRSTLRAFGASQDAVEKWIPILPIENRLTSTGTTNQTGIKLCHEALLPGKHLDSLQSILLGKIHESMVWHALPTKTILCSTPETKTISLLKWCSEVLIDSATHAFFGSRLLQIDPDLYERFNVFDESSWKLYTGYPRLLSREVHESKDKIRSAMTAFFRLPKGDRSGISWLIGRLETEMKNLGITEEDIAAIMVPMFWVINSNTYKTCFWMLCYILYDTALLAAVRAEIDPTCSDTSGGLECRLERCPHLQAVFLEVLRLTSSAATVRGVQNTTQIGAKVLREGTTIFIPSRELHLNESVFGPNTSQFDTKRFLDNEHLRKNPCFKPFGGGSTYCPGRYLAQREVLTFVALALYRFDFSLAAEQDGPNTRAQDSLPRFPTIDRKNFCLGTLGPTRGEDLVVSIKPRTPKQAGC